MFSPNALYTLALMLAAGSFVQASPVNAEMAKDSVMLDRRATVDCGGGYRFLTAAQEKCYTDAINHLSARPPTTVTGSNGKAYPEYYGDQPNVEGIPASCKENYNDLRIYPCFVQDTTTFTDGSNPGLDRVVISRHTDGTKERCGLITHRGAASGQFKWCGI
ncbi:hypothetical protein PTNB85_07654 [Pyrenophora teres f. teres]|nr:hypothetical protein PTNB85_07654 [Pyrenophora teres f. teres]KAE8856933.1 hypothetical protein PTNB29_08000 [Pyrenophora teres f. teres]